MCLFKTSVKMEKKSSGQYFCVNTYVFLPDDCSVALTLSGQLLTHANARETPADKKRRPFPPAAEPSAPALVPRALIPASPRFLLLLSGLTRSHPSLAFISSCEDGVWQRQPPAGSPQAPVGSKGRAPGRSWGSAG